MSWPLTKAKMPNNLMKEVRGFKMENSSENTTRQAIKKWINKTKKNLT